MRAMALMFALAVAACLSPGEAPEAPGRSEVPPSDVRSASGPDASLEQAEVGGAPLEVDSFDTSAPAKTRAQTSSPSPARAVDGRYAVLVGVDDYPGEDEDLPSGRHDVEAMREVLTGTFGYRPENIFVLRDRRASRGQIRRAFKEHLAKAGAEGSALFYFSGHGLQMDGNRGTDAEADGQDEAIYVWADQGERGSTILDDDLGSWANGLPTDRVLIILDACHSGTGTRGPEGWVHGRAPKGVRYSDVAPTLDAPARADDAPVLARRHTLLAAARDREIALSGLPGDPSLFTAALTDALREAGAGLELADLMRGVRRTVQARSRQYRSEHTPQLEGRSRTVGEVFTVR